jgi:hypothetical protein
MLARMRVTIVEKSFLFWGTKRPLINIRSG